MNIQSPATDEGRNFRDIAFVFTGTVLGLIVENIDSFSFLGDDTELFSLLISSLLIIVNRHTRSKRG